ncbi:MAG: Nif3-like dinuclear metal center hexameric protein [Caldimicrobium sp.]
MPLKVKDFYSLLENLAPLELSEKTDNTGFQIASFEAEVTGILLSVNPLYSSLSFAKKEGLNLIITHHSLFYKPCSKIILEEYPGNIIYYAVKNDLNLISWHTPLDKIAFGVSEALAKELGLETQDFIVSEGENYGYGRVVIFKNYVKLSALAKNIKEILQTWVMLVGDPESKITKLGVCGGSGGFLKEYLKKQNINTLLTSDVKYHQAVEAKESGFNYLLIDHGVGESFVLKVLKEKIEEFLKNKGVFMKVMIFNEESPYLII